jgi:hypothetical protein
MVGSIEITVGAPPPPAVKQHHGNLILVAGGGVTATNTIREATLYLADLVYSRFKSRLFADEDIYYYRPIPWVDLDGDGQDDHIVDVNLEKEEFNVADFGQRITQWAANQSSDGPLYIYLIDHGDIGNFRLYPNQILTAAQLNNYLDVFQERTGRLVVVMIEACKSGTFINDIVRDGQNRIIITSADDKDSYMQMDGRISFTQFFADRLLEGNSLYQGYVKTKTALANLGLLYTNQMKPQIKEGQALSSSTVYVGGNFGIASLYPEIASQTPSITISAGTSQSLFAQLSSLERIEAVWAVITPPDYVPPSTTGGLEAPVVTLPTIKLASAGNGRFEGVYQDFKVSGDYRLIFYARNSTGYVTVSPPTFITVTGGQPTGMPGDVNDDKVVNLADAILALQIAAGITPTGQTITNAADVNGDGRIGLAEVIYILQKMAGVR